MANIDKKEENKQLKKTIKGGAAKNREVTVREQVSQDK